MKKYSLFWLLVICLFISSCRINKQVSISQDLNIVDYSFFVAGHTYGKPRVNNKGFHPPFKQKFDLIKSDTTIQFGVLTGDIVHRSSNRDWNEIDTDILALGKKVYFAPGNHDLTKPELFTQRYGETFKKFVYNSDLFIILDPNIDQWNISGEQLDFLKETLKRNRKKVNNIFVFFHQVLWWNENNIYKNLHLNSRSGRAKNINFWEEVEPLFNQVSNQVFMFAGDMGAFPKRESFMYHKYDNITLIGSGMGGMKNDNFIIVNVLKNKKVNYQLIALNKNDIDALGKLESYILK